MQQARPHLRTLAPYQPGRQMNEQGWTKLNTNECPFPPSPRVGEAIANALARLPKYPDPVCAGLRQAIAEVHGVGSDAVMIGNGSDELLALLTRLFCDSERPGAAMIPSYSLYPVLLWIQDAPFVPVEYGEDFQLPVDEIAGCGAGVFFLTSPNAPSGVGYSTGEIEALAGKFPGLLVVDEAYGDFASETAISLVGKVPNLCVTRSFSKSYGLAGLRVGYLLGSPPLVKLLDGIRDAYNVDALAQAGALAAIHDQPYFHSVIKRIRRLRTIAMEAFRERQWRVYPSEANFLLVQPRRSNGRPGEEVARDCFAFLESRKVLVRYFEDHALTREWLRISVGSEEQMQILMQTIDLWRTNG